MLCVYTTRQPIDCPVVIICTCVYQYLGQDLRGGGRNRTPFRDWATLPPTLPPFHLANGLDLWKLYLARRTFFSGKKNIQFSETINKLGDPRQCHSQSFYLTLCFSNLLYFILKYFTILYFTVGKLSNLISGENLDPVTSGNDSNRDGTYLNNKM